MGKSSLMTRTALRLQQAGTAVAVIDLTAFGRNLTPEQWYDRILARIGRDLRLEDELEDFWLDHERLPPLARFTAALEHILVSGFKFRVSGPHQSDGETEAQLPNLVLFIDEIDVVRSLPFSADEFFAAIRELYNRRTQEPAWARLTFCLLGVASPSDLIADTRLTPFNIGTRIELRDFTEAEAAVLGEGLGPQGPALLRRVLHWTGGHPYLTQRLCRAVADRLAAESKGSSARNPQAEVDALCAGLFFEAGARDTEDNLRFVSDRMVRGDADKHAVLDLYGKVRRGERVPDDETDPVTEALRLSGAVKREGGRLRLRNRIYERVFDAVWIARQTDAAEVRRQREAFQRGRNRTLAVAAAVVAVFMALSAFALRESGRASREAARARAQAARFERLVYIANMGQIQGEWEANNVGRVEDLLEETRAAPDRGFEWGYWNRLRHLDLLTLHGHTGSVYSVAFAPDGKRLVTGSADKTAKVWDADTGRAALTLTLTLKGHTDYVSSVAFSPDGQRLVTVSRDMTAKLWDAHTGREIRTLRGHTRFVTSVAFSPDGMRLVTGSADHTAKVWDAHTGRELWTLKGHTYLVLSVAFSPDGQRLITGSYDQTAKVWDAHTGREALTLKGHRRWVRATAFSPDGKRLVTGSGDQMAKVWDAHTGREVLALKGHPGRVSSVAFSPDGKRLATGSDDKTAKVWDAHTGREIQTLKGHTDSVSSVAFSPNGERLVTGSRDKTVKVWDAHTGRAIWTLKGHTDRVSSVAFSPEGQRLVTGSWDLTAKVWDAHTGREIRTLRGHAGAIFSVVFSPDGKRLVTGSGDLTAKVWDAHAGRAVLTLKGHTDVVYSVAFSPDGKRVVTGGLDQTAKVWTSDFAAEMPRPVTQAQ